MAVALGLVLLVSKVFDTEQPVSVHLLIRSIGGNLLCLERYGRLVVTTFCIYHDFFHATIYWIPISKKRRKEGGELLGEMFARKLFLYKKMWQ